MERAASLRGGRAAATSRAIEDAALDLSLERGYENVTVDMICEQVGISQRTFFNHFPTKDDALLGHGKPQLDERAARRFILDDGPVLTDALTLVQLANDGMLPRRMNERMQVVSTSPALLVRQMERFAEIEDEITEVISLRLQHQQPEASELERAQEASLTTHLLMGALHWTATQVDGTASEAEGLAAAVELARRMLLRTLRDSKSPLAE